MTLATLVLISSAALVLLPSSTASGSSPRVVSPSGGLPVTSFVSAPPNGAAGPDDITSLAVDGLDAGRALIWTAYQNGINPNGTPGTRYGPTQSTVAGYDPISGSLIRMINVSGKVDGLTGDAAAGKLIATANEDASSVLNIIDPETGSVTTYAYSPSPEVTGNGGTDSIAVKNGAIYISHSNPSDTTQATAYLLHLNTHTLTAQLTPVFFDNSWATDAVKGATYQLALTDPDTNFIMPKSGERFAGDLATISQGDGKIIFASHLHGPPKLWVLNVTDNVPGNVPPIDGLAVATSNDGTLYVVDGAAGSITALNAIGWAKGTVFVGEPNDNGNPLIGVLNLYTGVITPLGNHFLSPKGMLFTPDHPGTGLDQSMDGPPDLSISHTFETLVARPGP